MRKGKSIPATVYWACPAAMMLLREQVLTELKNMTGISAAKLKEHPFYFLQRR